MASTKPFQLDSFFLTDIGTKRKQNQDAGAALPDLGLFIVADGMGGHQGGEIASQMCVETLTQILKETKVPGDPNQFEQALQIANQSIFDRAAQDVRLEGMGTTATVLQIWNSIATILQVGDSRAYYWNSDGIWQLTSDHSLVQEKLRAGLITRDQLKSDGMKNVITRSVGYELGLKVDRYTFPVERGDGFLLCSDGLSGPIDDSLMFEILEESEKKGLSLSETASKLIETANVRGGDDNSTVVLVKVL